MSMADHDEEELQLALRLSMQPHKSQENFNAGGEVSPPKAENRPSQRGLMAADADNRMTNEEIVKDVKITGLEDESKGKSVSLEKCVGKSGSLGMSLSVAEANQLFLMIFGTSVSKDVLAQWCNQGIRFSDDPETSMGLVQHEGGPCGVLATIQAFVLRYLLFSQEESSDISSNLSTVSKNEYVAADIFSSLSEEKKSRALMRSISEILFLSGNNKRAVIASLNILDGEFVESANGSSDEVISKAIEGLSFESGSDFQKLLRVDTYTSPLSALQKLESMLPIFRSRMGALLFLISALLSRGLENVQEDRDDPSQPLVTAPFGHASQEIVNLLLSGSGVANVFDGNMDLGGGMFVKGISTSVEVGFLTLLESLNYCKVGQYLKSPKWPIWVVGSESHYTVLFALDPKVQEENELESRESQIRRTFDAHDQSGGGGFISVEGFHQVVSETSINLPHEKVDSLCSSGFIVWSEFWRVLLDLDKNLGGVKDSTGLMGNKVFDLYHFNGIAKVSSRSENSIQRPRLTKLRVLVPPAEEFMADMQVTVGSGQVSNPEPAQHAPLVDCIRTRWARAVCNWEGDAPSIV